MSLRSHVGRLLRETSWWKRTQRSAWHKQLGGRLEVGDMAAIGRAQLVVRESECRLSIGSYSNVEAAITLERNGATCSIGNRTHLGAGTTVSCAESISIGSDVLIAFGVLIMDHNAHALDFEHRRSDVTKWLGGEKDWTHVPTAPVVLEDEVWIGARAIVLKGVTIGRGAVVGAGAVVTRSVPSGIVVAGNPAVAVGAVPQSGRP